MNPFRSLRFTLASLRTLLLVFVLASGTIYTGSAAPLNGVPFNNILLLDGIDDFATAPDNANLDLGTGAAGDFTIEGFFFVLGLNNTTNDTLVWKAGAYGLNIIYFNTRTDIIVFRVSDGPQLSDEVSILFAVNLTPGWHHIAAVYNNEFTEAEDQLALYLNGTRVQTGAGFDFTAGVSNSTSPVAVGAYHDIATLDHFNGRLDEVRFSSVMRYNAASYTVPASPFANDANTRALWHFNEAAGATIFSDSSGKGNTLSGLNGARIAPPVAAPIIVSGNIGVAQVALGYTDTVPKTTTTVPGGSYSFTVPNNWSGTVTPSHACYTFAPASRNYVSVTTNQTAGNYTPTFKAASGCADIHITTNANPRGRYGLPPGASARASFAGLNDGVVELLSLSGVSFLPAERVIYKVNGVNTSFTEMMALPNTQLATPNWLPWYDNVNMDTQLRFGNATNLAATVRVFIGGQEMTGSPFTVGPYGSTRKSYPGINNGPVRIVSTQNIVASERVIYKANGVNTSFSEMMALPNSQLDTTFWLPWYNNSGDLNTQLRIANATNQQASVHIFIGAQEMTGSPFNLAGGSSTSKSYPGVNSGPVRIVSTQNIVASERVIYKVNAINASFSEMMALPNSQLDTTFWLPWYNNVGLDTQLRIANVSNATATVHVTIGGVEMTGSPFNLGPGASARKSFAGIDKGPVKVQSNQNIVAAERLIYKVNNVATSFSEMMALPNSELYVIYWLPHYNNVDLDTQLRFGVP
jgi:uncharacterized protein YcfL